MRSYRRRPKKLTVAFHFLFANQAAWKCDECRSKGLDKKRRCARGPITDQPRVVWARNGIAVSSCPKSVITGESLAWIEEYQARRTFGDFGGMRELPGKTVDAFCLLEQLLAKERSNEQ
jgi:hypothetical protein